MLIASSIDVSRGTVEREARLRPVVCHLYKILCELTDSRYVDMDLGVSKVVEIVLAVRMYLVVPVKSDQSKRFTGNSLIACLIAIDRNVETKDRCCRSSSCS